MPTNISKSFTIRLSYDKIVYDLHNENIGGTNECIQ